MTAEQLSRLRQRIETQVQDIHLAMEQWRACNGLDENGGPRIVEPDARAIQQEWKNNTDRHMRQLLRLLCRMEEEDFGVCVNCGEDIPLRRLEMVPTTTLCAVCMARREARAGAI